MATKKNKVKFNICNVHYALITVSEEGEVAFGMLYMCMSANYHPQW